jgi:hypothetical protein
MIWNELKKDFPGQEDVSEAVAGAKKKSCFNSLEHASYLH